MKKTIEPEYKINIRRIIEDNLVHSNFEALLCPEDKYRGCLGHKYKHIDIMVDRIWNMFRPVQSVGQGPIKAEDKKEEII